MKIKIFCDSSITEVENKINQWLAKNPTIEFISITQSESGVNGKINVSIFYESRKWMEENREGGAV